MTYTQSADAMAYLGEVAAWLQSAPEGKKTYGEFYVSKVSVVFDGELIGTYVSDDPDWLFEATP